MLQSGDATFLVQGLGRIAVSGRRNRQRRVETESELLDGGNSAKLLGSVVLVLPRILAPATRAESRLGCKTAGQRRRKRGLSALAPIQKWLHACSLRQKLHIQIFFGLQSTCHFFAPGYDNLWRFHDFRAK